MFKGSSGLSHLIFEINVGKGRFRHRRIPILNQMVIQMVIQNSESLHVGSDAFRY